MVAGSVFVREREQPPAEKEPCASLSDLVFGDEIYKWGNELEMFLSNLLMVECPH